MFSKKLFIFTPMNKFYTTIASIVAITASTCFAAPAFPFPQNKAHPFGNTFKNAKTSVIKSHFDAWKKTWYTEAGSQVDLSNTDSQNANKGMPGGTARVISPNEDRKMTVSEGIAYGMLIMVYMSDNTNDYSSQFEKLWKFWKSYMVSGGSVSGMHWKINSFDGKTEGQGSASDADFDAATALIMASKQWNNATYLNDAKTLINWIKSNDMESDGRVRPGSNWNDAFNPSYSTIAAFQLFYNVTNDSFWQTAIKTTMDHLLKCQDATTGLMPDWCDWSSHKATSTSAAVSGGYKGFYDDAARTPWRMAWAYYWYGNEEAKQSNDKIITWLDKETFGYPALILPGYNLDGSSPSDIFVSSTYAGGLGLSMASATNPGWFLENLYYTLANTEGKDAINAKKGENYFAATLNILYMLLFTGNMPDFNNIDKFTTFTPDPDGVRKPKAPEGTLMPENSGATVSGFEHWGSYCDKFGMGTVMYPDSGSTGIYKMADGSYQIQTELFVASEPTYEPNKQLNYPFAGLAVSFDKDHKYYDLSDLQTVRVTYKSQGLMRFAILDEETLIQKQEGGEPGAYLHPTDDFITVDIDISGDASDEFKSLDYPSWVNYENSRSATLKAVRGVKFDAKMIKGGYASFNLKEVMLLDGNGTIISALKGVNAVPKSLPTSRQTFMHEAGQIMYSGFGKNAKIYIFDLNGTQVYSRHAGSAGSLDLNKIAAKGAYIARIVDGVNSKQVRILK